tara:strand:+ start:1062 stop:2252 length:1191 start_codon:yes stop_codon:yes gene_type:complete
MNALANLTECFAADLVVETAHEERCEVIVPRDDPDWHVALEGAWRDLGRNAVEPNVFFEYDFLVPSLREMARDDDVRIVTLWCGSTLVGLCPITSAKSFPRIPIRTASIWLHEHMFFAAPLVRPGFEEAFWSQLIAAVERQWWGGIFRTPKVLFEGKLSDALERVCRAEGRAYQVLNASERAMIAVPDDAEAYWRETVSKKRRKELARQYRRLEDLGELRFGAVCDTQDLDFWIDEFLQLEASGWKGEGGTALNQDPPTVRFFRDAVHGAARSGKLQIVHCRLDDKTIAMIVNFMTQDGGFGFKTAFDEDYYHFSPGVQLQRELLGRLKDRNVAWMDSCASQDHPMIDGLWRGRRKLGVFAVGLKGAGRPQFAAAFLMASRLYRRFRSYKIERRDS